MVSRALPRYFTRCIVGEMQLIQGSIQVHMGIGGMKHLRRMGTPSIIINSSSLRFKIINRNFMSFFLCSLSKYHPKLNDID